MQRIFKYNDIQNTSHFYFIIAFLCDHIAVNFQKWSIFWCTLYLSQLCRKCSVKATSEKCLPQSLITS